MLPSSASFPRDFCGRRGRSSTILTCEQIFRCVGRSAEHAWQATLSLSVCLTPNNTVTPKRPGLNSPERVKGWYNLAGGGAGFLVVETEITQELTAFLHPSMDLMSFDVRAIYGLNDEQHMHARREAGRPVREVE